MQRRKRRKRCKRQKRYHLSALDYKVKRWCKNSFNDVQKIAYRTTSPKGMGEKRNREIMQKAQQSLLLLEFFIFLINILGDNERIIKHFSKLKLLWKHKRVNFVSLLFIGWSFSAHPLLPRETNDKPSLFFLGKTNNGSYVTFALSIKQVKNNYSFEIHKICDPTKIMYGSKSFTSYGKFITPLTMTNERLLQGCKFGTFQGENEEIIRFLSINFVREPIFQILLKIMYKLPMDVLNIMYKYLFIH
jgi:hypothetical protein